MKSMGSRTLTRALETSCRPARNTTPASRHPLLAQGCASAQGSIQLSSPVRRNIINIGYNATAGGHYCHSMVEGHCSNNEFKGRRKIYPTFLYKCTRCSSAAITLRARSKLRGGQQPYGHTCNHNSTTARRSGGRCPWTTLATALHGVAT